jgi:putative ABC transport system permease protein
MKEFFGADMLVLSGVLAAMLIIVLVVVVFLGLRNRILVKLAIRNIPRRPAQTTLIVVGLMLSTTIISASLAIGDTVTGSIRGVVLDGLGYTDIRVRAPINPGDALSDNYLDASALQSVLDQTSGDSRIDGVLPQIRETLPVLNQDSNLTEARMQVAGLDVSRGLGFGDITSISGEKIALSSLASGEVLLNESAANEIDANAGDTLTVVTPTGRQDFTLRAVVRNGDLAANDRRLLMSLTDMQRVMEREGQVNRIDISLTGGREGPAADSKAVADYLRIAFTDAVIAGQLHDALNRPDIIAAIKARIAENPGNTITGDTKKDLNDLVSELESGTRGSDRFRALVANNQVVGQVLAAVESAGLTDQLLPLSRQYVQVVVLGVDELKQDGLRLAALIGSVFVTFFTIFGSFSIIVGLLLIFLVFVMLAAERSNEMGIARAVGTKRRHLVQMFTFEGVAYSIGAAIVGTIAGIAASRLLVVLLVSAVGTGGEQDGFTISFSVTATSVVAGFSLGLLLTLATVGISAYRVSKLNIVVAIRGLPAEFQPSEVLPLVRRFQNLGIALISPVWQVYRIVTFFKPDRSIVKDISFLLIYLIVPVWVGRIIFSLWHLVSPYFGTGIPQIVFGLLVAISGINISNAFLFMMGASLFLVGIGQIARWWTYRSGMRRSLADRIGFSLMGLMVLGFWALPFDALDWLTGELGGGIEMFVLSGVWMVASAVWVLMYNADLIAYVVQSTFGRNRTLGPILKPAIAYPTSSRFRTGLTVAMFALVIFTMMVFSILNNAGSDIVDTPYKANGGFDVRAETSADLPITDLRAAIAASPTLNPADFSVIAANTDLPAQVRQVDASELRFLGAPVRGVDENYLRTTEFELSHYDPSYLPAGIDVTDRRAVARAIWDRLAADPTLAVVSNTLLAVPAGGGGPAGFGGGGFRVEGIAQDADAQIEAFEISIKGQRSQSEAVQRTVIAAVDPFAGSYESQDGNAAGVITTSAAIFDQISETPVPFTVFRIKLATGADPGRVAAAMETAFLDNGLLATDTLAEIKNAVAQSNAFGRLFQAFMGLGLVVGVASLGVLSFRAVVERRLSIGMMRAIGYKSRMIQVQFLLESVFVTILGTALGIGLGALISWNIVNSINDTFDGLAFNIPWLTVTVIVVIAVIASLLTTFIPARQASKIYPSEALRYE